MTANHSDNSLFWWVLEIAISLLSVEIMLRWIFDRPTIENNLEKASIRHLNRCSVSVP